MCDVPSTALFCSESIECFPGIVSRFFLKFFVTIPVVPIIITTTTTTTTTPTITTTTTTLLHCAIVDAGNNYSNLHVSGEGAFLVMADGGEQLAWIHKALHAKHPYTLTQPYFSSTA
jgi:hypothetical protein